MSTLWSILFLLALGGTVATVLRPRAGFLFPLLGIIGWLGVLSQWYTTPPLGVTAGDPTHIIIMMAPIVGVCACVLYPFYIQRQITHRSHDPFNVGKGGGGTEYSEETWHLPSWLGGKDPMAEKPHKRSRISAAEYKQTMHDAFRGRRRR